MLRYAQFKSDPFQRRYAKIQVAGFIMSCGAMLLWAAGGIDAMTELGIEIGLLVYRGANEAAHGEFDASAYWHHGAFFLVYLLLLYVQSWQDLYAATTVQMQILHVPMTLWYLGGRSHCLLSSQRKRRICIALFRPVWLASCAFRAGVLVLAAAHAEDAAARSVLATCTAVFMALDSHWTMCFFSRIGPLSLPPTLFAGLVGICLAVYSAPPQILLDLGSIP